MVSDPFDINDPVSYGSWRIRKLAAYPAGMDSVRVEVARLAAPSAAELVEIRRRMGLYNLALVCSNPDQVEPRSLLALGDALGLRTADTNLFADRRAVSTIAAGGEDDRSEYIPYTDKPLSWHTDGYYNQPQGQVGAWTLFCLRPAARGGANQLMDPEIAYILLRDRSPDHIRALSHPDALTIPANTQGGQAIRAASTGPVFSVQGGHLHMRYTARARHAIWRDSPATQAARIALDRLFSDESSYTFSHILGAGEGYISNNVLHNRSGFSAESAPEGGPGRLLYRIRYRERVDTQGGHARP